jgi:predicted alpha/beta superfamily hydrolase
MGSSMGGLVSLYGFFRRSDTFGFAGVMSPSLWFAGGAIFQYVAQAAPPQGTLYLDMGGRESIIPPRPGSLSAGLRNARRMHTLLQRKGYLAGRNLRYVEAPDAEHTEAAWAHRLPGALRFLLRHAEQPTAAQQHLITAPSW